MKLLHRDFHIDFMGKKNIFFIISAACLVVIALWGVIFGVDLDISFKGGTIFTYTYTDANADLDEGALTAAAQSVLGEEVEVEPKQDLANNTPSLDISMTSAVTMEDSSIEELTAALQQAAPDLGLEYSTITSVNPSIGMDFFAKCLVAVGVGIIIMIIYLGIRFRLINGWKAAITAVLALVHDMIFVYGTFVICGFPLDSNFIAVMLTILGYSANNTVIIYDRIRENTKLFGKKTSRSQIVNDSINQTLSRSIGTSFCTLLAMVVVCVVAGIFGVMDIFTFALPMIVGLLAGTYSSICIASELWVVWQDHSDKKKKAKGRVKARA